MIQRQGLILVACLGVLVLSGTFPARGQTTNGNANSTGIGLVAVPGMVSTGSSFGLMAVPMASGTGTSGSGTNLAGTAADPMGMSMMVGPSIPMTPGQAGMFMLSAQQRMLGLGNGQLSGARPGRVADPKAAKGRRGTPEAPEAASHTRNSNIPGGQAKRYFNRGGLAESGSRPFYNRQMRYFPSNTQ